MRKGHRTPSAPCVRRARARRRRATKRLAAPKLAAAGGAGVHSIVTTTVERAVQGQGHALGGVAERGGGPGGAPRRAGRAGPLTSVTSRTARPCSRSWGAPSSASARSTSSSRYRYRRSTRRPTFRAPLGAPGQAGCAEGAICRLPGRRAADGLLAPVGWAGWDHLARARALATWYLHARRDGRDVARLLPLLAGLAELVPWLRHWYDGPNPDPALDRPGSQIAAFVVAELRGLHLTADDLAAWRPEPPRRGRRGAAGV